MALTNKRDTPAPSQKNQPDGLAISNILDLITYILAIGSNTLAIRSNRFGRNF